MAPQRGKRGGARADSTAEDPAVDTIAQSNRPKDDDEDLEALWDAPPTFVVPRQVEACSSSSQSSEQSTIGPSSDSEAEDEITTTSDMALPAPQSASSALPCATAMFAQVTAPPTFLNQESAGPSPGVVLTMPGASASQDAPPAESRARGRRRGRPHGDISRLAPKLAPEGGLAPGTISARATSSALDGGQASGASAEAIAMLGGQLPASRGERGKAVGAMPVSEFLDAGGVALPRKRQDRKEKEKDKRQRGQSTHSSWKSEAEMALRQQYD